MGGGEDCTLLGGDAGLGGVGGGDEGRGGERGGELKSFN